MANWYVENLEMKVVSQQQTSPFMMFLADRTDRVVVELYHSSKAKISDCSKSVYGYSHTEVSYVGRNKKRASL